MAQMADDEKNQPKDNTVENDPKSIHYHFTVKVNISDINENNTNDLCFTLQFINLKTHQVYFKQFSVKEAKQIISKVPLMPINGFTKLLNDALSINNIKSKFNVEWKVIQNEYENETLNNKEEGNTKNSNNHYLDLNIIWERNDAYIPDVTFNIKIPAKQMNEIDLLKLRLESLETKYDKTRNELEILKNENKNNKPKWKDAVFVPNDTGMLLHGQVTQVAKLVLPTIKENKKYRFLARYSAEIRANSTGGYWVYYEMKFGGNRLVPYGGGLYFWKNVESYPFPVSQSVVIQVDNKNGKYESENSRTLEFQFQPSQTYQSGVRNVCLECYEL